MVERGTKIMHLTITRSESYHVIHCGQQWSQLLAMPKHQKVHATLMEADCQGQVSFCLLMHDIAF